MYSKLFYLLVITLANLTIAASPTPDSGKGTRASKGSSIPGAASTGVPATSAGRIIAVVVGSTDRNKSLAFTPSTIEALPGDIVQFQFSLQNHTVTQSTFAEPCTPIQAVDSSAPGINSGFVPQEAGAATVATFNMPINNTTPMFLYCAQGPHCQLGMVMAINPTANETFAAYKEAAAKATSNVPAERMQGGVMGSIPASQAVPPPV